MPLKTKIGIWIDETLEAAMDVVERKTHYLRKANKSWNIPMGSIVDHLNGKTISRKLGPIGVLIEENDVVMIKWTLDMQECGLSLNLQQLKMKVVELT
jgi:hypothetical protein